MKKIIALTTACLFLIAGSAGGQAAVSPAPDGARRAQAAEMSVSEEIAREIQKIRDAGEPATIEELVPPDLPEAENGARVYARAFSLREELKARHQAEWAYIPLEGSVRWAEAPEAEKAKVRNLLRNDPDFAEFYRRLETAAGMECRFVTREEYARGAWLNAPNLVAVRSCARLLAARSVVRSEAGEADAALRDCLSGLKMSGAVAGEPILISALVRSAVIQIFLDRLEEAMGQGEADPATGRALAEAIGEMRRETVIYDALLGERVIYGRVEFARLRQQVVETGKLGDIGALLPGQSVGGNAGNDPAGFVDSNELAYFRFMAGLAALARAPYWEAREKLVELEKELAAQPSEKAGLIQLFMPSLTNVIRLEARLDARLGAAEIALACRSYRDKHGDYPGSLAVLGPEFLPEPPRDPFTGEDYRYRKEPGGFTVYSVGENGTDDGGQWGPADDKWGRDLPWRG